MEDFKFISEYINTHRRSFEPANLELLDPLNANPLVMGEWLELTTNGKKVQRGASGATPASVPSWPLIVEAGRSDTQSAKKVALAYLGPVEVDTKIMDATGLTVGAAVGVADVTVGALTKRGLKAVGAGLAVGYVTRLPADNNGYLRVIRTLT